ncbi:MAG: glucose-1-phosphate cytidylyltransferase [Actinomycetota bacterium]|nr:glucose-1-phosphate cytidylyltransferase [Actinomycetota bacterium]
MKVIVLAGGLGTRLREETEYRPKPMVEIGGLPIIWHIMKNFSYFGLTDFVVAAGYRGEVVKEYFLNFRARAQDFTVNLGTGEVEYHDAHSIRSDWSVTVADTGRNTMTGGRVKRASRYVDGRFMVTYGDGLADVDIGRLLDFHESHGRLATVTTTRPTTRFGVLDVGESGMVERFREKPQTDGHVNAGFFVFEPGVLDYLSDDCVLEREPLERLAADRQLVAFEHKGFWQPMDTFREFQMLNEMWDSGNAPWKLWS